MSDRAKVIFEALQQLGEKVTSYDVLALIQQPDFWKSENLENITEPQYIKETLNIKGINTLIASLVRKELVAKTMPETITTKDGKTRNLRRYYII
jgi:hypothetical protein